MVPHINRCKSLYLKCKKFREILRDDKNPNHMLIGMTFSAFFGETIDKGVFAVLPKDVTYAYLSYLSKNVHVADDKYMRSATNFILANSDGIDAFVKTFLCIRLAQGEIDKLKTA